MDEARVFKFSISLGDIKHWPWDNKLPINGVVNVTWPIFSPHGIVVPKGLYFTAVVFSFFLFSTPNLWGHWTDLNHTCTNIHLWLLFEKFDPNFPEHSPLRAGGNKPLFWDRLWTLTEHISATSERDINNRKKRTCQSTGTPLHAPKFSELSGPETAENGLRVFAQPANFHKNRCSLDRQTWHRNVPPWVVET